VVCRFDRDRTPYENYGRGSSTAFAASRATAALSKLSSSDDGERDDGILQRSAAGSNAAGPPRSTTKYAK
jgi:hypothetical protein